MKYVIIGVGAAGITAAKTIQECDSTAEIVMISSDESVHSRCMLHKYMSGERDEKTLSFVPDDFFETNHITWIRGIGVNKIVSENHKVLLNDGREIVYDKLLIATGSYSFVPPIGNFKRAKNVFGLRDLGDAKAIMQMIKPESKVLIVGSGLVGLDAAYALLERKNDVTVVEMADRILPLQLDAVAGEAYQKLFEQAGCKFILSRKAAGTTMSADGVISKVILDDGRELPCDIIIVAAGVRSAIACVEGTDIKAQYAIEVNPQMQTSVQDIYAAGDVTGLSGIWPNAMKQGQVAAYNMCGKETVYEDTYAMKNTINFFGLATLSLGRGEVQEGDEVVICEDKNNYKKAIIRDGKLDSIVLQGNIDYSGDYQYLIKHKIPISTLNKDIFHVTFADYYGIQPDGQYEYCI